MCVCTFVCVCLSVCIRIKQLIRDTHNCRQTSILLHVTLLDHSIDFLPSSLFLKEVNIYVMSCPFFRSQEKAWPQLTVLSQNHMVKVTGLWKQEHMCPNATWLARISPGPSPFNELFYLFTRQIYFISILETSQALYLNSLKSGPQMKRTGLYTHSKLFNSWLKLWHCKSNGVATIELLIWVK